MKYKTLALDEKRPRNVDLIRKALPLYSGVRPYYFFGIFALVGPLIPLVMIVTMVEEQPIPWAALVASLFIFEAIAFLLLFQGNKIYQNRLKALVEGYEVEGTVVAQGRNFVFWKSAKNYNITIEFEFQNEKHRQQIQSSHVSLHQQFPKGTKVWGLYASKRSAICFPIEFGIILEPQIEQNRKASNR